MRGMKPRQKSEVVDKVVAELRERAPELKGTNDGRWQMHLAVDWREREIYPDGDPYLPRRIEGMVHDFGYNLTAKLLNAGRHTVNFTLEEDRRGLEYVVSADICPVQMRQVEMLELVPAKPKVKIVEKIVERVVEVQLPPVTVSERLRLWWAEMTSPVVYDGPRGDLTDSV
jgi:hypothetical protein